MTPDLSVTLGRLKMKNPVTVASGTFGYGREYAELIDVAKLGAVTVKAKSGQIWRELTFATATYLEV